jgi:hypothetical protein
VSSDSYVLASRAELVLHNRRVRRLARAYAPKYRPIVLSLGYHTNLADGMGRTYVKVDTIVAESARYTASGKPLQARYVKRLLAEMITAGAVKSEERFREDTGRQTSSYRTLVTSVSLDRRGFARLHDFEAPFTQVSEEKDTPRDTPRDTPQDTAGDTPQDTRTVFDLASDSLITSHHHEADGGSSEEESSKSKSTSKADGASAPRESQWVGSGENATDNREWLAGQLGVPVGSIGAPLLRYLDEIGAETYRALDGCHCRCKAEESGDCTHGDEPCSCICPASGNAEECECPPCQHALAHALAYKAYDWAVRDAAGASAGKKNPVGYFRSILPSLLEQALADVEAARVVAAKEAAAKAAQARRDEILAKLEGINPKVPRVRPLAGRELNVVGGVEVWHHPAADMIVWGAHEKGTPGPGWEPRFMSQTDWTDIQFAGVIELREERFGA